MTPLRVGAVGYLNARPLVHGLDRHPDRFSLRFDPPSKCATLLHEGAIDLGLIPSVEAVGKPDYRIVDEIGVISEGPVASVALFASRPTTAIRSIALDSSSRTSAVLIKILCAQWFDIEPKFVTLPPDLGAMLKRADAALLIGDLALSTDADAAGVDKVDLGEEWTAMTGLPFVWAFWAARAPVLEPPVIDALKQARDEGTANLDAIAAAYGGDDEERVERAIDYLRNNVRYVLDDAARSGLRKFFDLAGELRVVPPGAAPRFA
jgi:chorismate dehydratase